MSETNELGDFMDAATPLLRASWSDSIEQGRQGRRNGEPRTFHGRSTHRACYFRGWDEEDEKMRGQETGEPVASED